ncbi:MAG: penicillin-binding protein 2 [Synergistaceae bacterium]|jgi:cell division protein FtsI (penicillin-binding protein 3)/stage V sporulation protein D (sporulation-specific penicillin-binding protein)|nr:penicillin-binding protein 2 [Synergistaceae bacterium]
MARKRYFISPWLFFIGLFGFVVWKLVEYHCFPDPRVLFQAQHQYWSRTPIKYDRGIIHDNNKNILALSVPASSFFIDPERWSPSSASSLKGLVSENVLKKISGSPEGRYVRLVRMVPPETAQKIRMLNLKGLYEEKEKKREYPNGALLSHVLGFCDIDGNGQAGIELAWDSALYDSQGYKIMIRQSGGRSLVVGGTGIYNRGNSVAAVTLTIDTRIQYIVEKYLNEVISEHNAKWGTIICMNPNTGAILSMASWPTFNPNNRDELLNSNNIINNAVGRAYEPGSTFKTVFMGIALENGLVRTHEVFNCPARIQIADGFISEAYQRAMGNISTADILIKSSNVGMAQIGVRAKPIDMYRTLLNWGFGKPSEIELKGTEKGLLVSPGQWRGVVSANISIGQGLAVTPLQLITAIAAIVNNGKLLSPYLVEEAVDSTGTIVYRGSKNVIREVLTPDTSQWLRKVMRETVLSGTGRQANTPITEIAAKTGTAQVAEKGTYAKGRYVSSFVGFWPYNDPQYLMLIVVGEPAKGKYYGGEVAGPVFKKIVEGMADLEIFESGGEELL